MFGKGVIIPDGQVFPLERKLPVLTRASSLKGQQKQDIPILLFGSFCQSVSLEEDQRCAFGLVFFFATYECWDGQREPIALYSYFKEPASKGGDGDLGQWFGDSVKRRDRKKCNAEDVFLVFLYSGDCYVTHNEHHSLVLCQGIAVHLSTIILSDSTIKSCYTTFPWTFLV